MDQKHTCAHCGGDTRRPHDLMTYWRGRQQPLAWLAHVLDIYTDDDNDLGGDFEFHGTYGSTLDLEVWKAHLCEACCVELRGWINSGGGPGCTETNALDQL